MKINDHLNLVFALRPDGPTCYHVPISREVFEANYRTIAGAKSAMMSKGAMFMVSSGPRIAALTLRDEGRKEAAERWEYDGSGQPLDGGVSALMAEIRRLTTILCPAASGWNMLPVDTAIASGAIDEDDWREAESQIVFFTCNCALATKAEKKAIMQATASVLKGSITSLAPMEFIASLPTLTKNDATETKLASSLPS